MASYMCFPRKSMNSALKVFAIGNTLNCCRNQNAGQLLLKRSLSQWHLVSAVCLERKPIITQELTPIEKEYRTLVDKVEFEQSLKCDHELRHEDDLKRAKRIKNSEIKDSDLEAIAQTTVQDIEDQATAEYNQFTFASRTTEADEANDNKSVRRYLDKHLLFVIREKLGNDYHWHMPQTVRQKDENMRQAAERVFKEVCGDKLKAQFIGNAPVGYYKYKYPKAARVDGIIGAKVFFFKAWHNGGSVSIEKLKENPGKDDFLWLTRGELKEYLQNDYCKSVQKFLVDESEPQLSEETKEPSVRSAAHG